MGLLFLGLVAGLAAVERKGFLQAMLSRPIALAPVAGWVLGDAAGGLVVAAPLELLWLGAVNLGAAVPVHEALGAAAIAGGAVLAGRAVGSGVTPEVAVLAVLLAAPVALVGRRADKAVEGWNERLARHAEAALASHRVAEAARSNLYGLAAPFAIAAVLAPLSAWLAEALIPRLLAAVPGAAAPLRVGYFAFAALACAAGAKALRSRAAPRLFFAAFAAAFAALLTWRLLG
ncbi:PTS sugar transporter subunit IIC [Anaeromyxobacter dehalogenans]|uniref:Phosphotransferase system PTS sorbose-specific IIC subunit n=1 Tax=Anaeromyxobacter dehalogenans (strain 2CP-C) TaxID=290397 RepID=Q2IM93_ANADE|nr:PTS sugar transporter subunit IIC [Anaeromyxobacter dehalogenans]ABC79927.1 hypothetical protein Adeh_0150 [Anaeromyxobacter dehalogenans 2CP-C]